MHIDINEDAAEEIQRLATALEWTPEQTEKEIVTNGIHMLRRYAFLMKSSKSVDVAEAIEILNRAGAGNPPDPGDELPEDLQYLLTERNR